jgi:polyhydroxybutyrate depolymerase
LSSSLKTPLLLSLAGVIVLAAACSGADASIPGAVATKDAGSGPTTTATSTSTAPTSTSSAGADAAPPVVPVATWASQPKTSPGCGVAATTSPADGDSGSVTVDGVTRTFVYYVPAKYDPSKAYPLITLFHGIQATGEEMAQYIMMQVYSAPNAIVAFPDAANGYWDLTGATDLLFMDALSAQLESKLCINEQRTFALGFSLGAYMANHFACNRPTLRAFVAADGGYPDTGACKAPVAALIYHRNEDDNEVIANGINARDQWLTNDSCGTTTTPFGGDGFQLGGDVSGPAGCVAYSGCTGTAPVYWCDDLYVSPGGYKHDLRDVYRTPMWNWFNSF